ncbi:malto-oligosyltrehalose trehalohydrolase [Herbaspirillum rubrisubalbicans]|uniref:malto-oligosyltrehalose trehalohydrolase n=1 Tax=Herbaspirillum rubrisubalbicans TaxID=80842 RepID=UPI001559E769|nr:malto-oligosyltrehalose trehalohydrolase [Herbaspirillum rubrisubalbicans]NQE47142.1 malto-oligosyltrehalose trehalohydrolase [Herbaspirillum rubrisubalbicans]
MSARFSVTLPFGAQVSAPGQVRFRVWAPGAEAVAVEIIGRERLPMTPEDAESPAWYVLEVPCDPGTLYRYVFQTRAQGEVIAPDPASRGQAGDVFDPSVVVDPQAYVWQYPHWQGRPWEETVLYELHPGAMGGFAGIQQRLGELAELGITAIELMPVAEFPGAHNWGYDGVLPFAPDASYGTPEQLKALIDTAHGLGMMVFLDVVYNHFGPDGNFLHCYAPEFFRQDRQTLWGASIDFRRPEVADFFTQNALYWLQEYRFDGLRLDAVHAICEPDWLVTLGQRIRAEIGSVRHVHLVLEHDGNAAHLLGYTAAAAAEAEVAEIGQVRQRSSQVYDAQWNDDAHHVLHVLLTGEDSGYYSAYADAPAEKLARCLQQGFVYQGEVSPYSGEPRGEPSADLPPTAFVNFLQNHDQIGNRAFGERLSVLAHPLALHAAQALILLAPQVPMLFMGEEFCAVQPFLYFTSHRDEALVAAVREGRRREFARFPQFADPKLLEQIPDPNSFATFVSSIPEPGPAPASAACLRRVAELLHLRRHHIAPYLRGAKALEARAIGPKAVHARWQLSNGSVLNITVNLDQAPLQETLDDLAQPAGADVLFDSGGALQALAEGSFPAHAILALREPASQAGRAA